MVEEPSVPAEVSIEEQRRISERDARFARTAAESRAKAEAKKAAGQPSTVREMLDSKFANIAKAIAADPSDHAERIPADEVPSERPRWFHTLRAAVVPPRFRDVSLDDYAPSTPGQEAALDSVRRWLARALAGEHAMLALIGAQGVGKSHLLYGAANALIDAERRIYARPWSVLADEIRYGGVHPIGGSAIEPDEVRRMLLRPSWGARIWLLDEVRATSGTAFDDTELTKLACHVYDACAPMMITTNTNPLSEVMGAPAASRFKQAVVDGPDWRQQ